MKVCLFRTALYWPIPVQLKSYSSHYNFHSFSLWKIITLQRIIVFCMWKAYHFDRWSLNYIRLIHCRARTSRFETLLYSAVFLSYCKNKLSKYYYSWLKECFMKWLCWDFFLSFFFVQKISFLLPFVLIAYFHYCVHADQKSGDIRVIKVDSHQAATV